MRKAERDRRRNFAYAVAGLFLFIFCGVILVEMQLNQLTADSGFTKVLNIRRGQAADSVDIYCMGEVFTLPEPDYAEAQKQANIYFRKASIALYGLSEEARQYYRDFF